MKAPGDATAAPRALHGFTGWPAYAVPLVVAGALLALENTAADTTISGWFFDPASSAFPLRNHYLLRWSRTSGQSSSSSSSQAASSRCSC